MPPSMKQALTCLELESQSALKDMELKVSPDAGRRIKRPSFAAGQENIRPDAFVAKIDIQIREVQNNVVRQAEVDAASACPSAADIAVALGKECRLCAPFSCGGNDSC